MKAVICDLDGSLMPPSSGLYVSKEVEKRLIELQKKGLIVILNSARILQGVYPLAKQICMDKYGGYVISCNGCHVMDAKIQETIFEYKIKNEDALLVWDVALKNGLNPGISQPEYMFCEDLVEGYKLDRNNCEVDYLLTRTPKKYMNSSIWKCCISQTKEKLDESFETAKTEIEDNCGLKVIRSTPTMVDIIDDSVDKMVAVDRLLKMIGIDWKDVSYIGDTNSDLGCIEKAGLGVTLENGSEACKKACDLLVPSCYEDGCIVWLDKLLGECK